MILNTSVWCVKQRNDAQRMVELKVAALLTRNRDAAVAAWSLRWLTRFAPLAAVEALVPTILGFLQPPARGPPPAAAA